jgi:hypothetical protein
MVFIETPIFTKQVVEALTGSRDLLLAGVGIPNPHADDVREE